MSTARPRRLAPRSVAAEQLGVSPRTIARAIERGDLTGYKIGPRLVRVDLDELEEYVTRITPTSAGGAR